MLYVKDSLLDCLKNKFKKERNPLTNLDAVRRMKEKYSVPGSGRKRSSSVEPSPGVQRKSRGMVCAVILLLSKAILSILLAGLQTWLSIISLHCCLYSISGL